MKYPIWWIIGEKITIIWVFQDLPDISNLQTVRILILVRDFRESIDGSIDCLSFQLVD